ncbi:tyrosine-type recombinase/integrase [Paucibacter sp. KBW04]|uniref:tyrosine-type recombinase/integrase n=1 Tax=Paucibacter sp. KBW04 TaxID=2153361 RepID=UPI0018CC217D|nr:tyrosine-type recombinase/integrase [Paucibacter sp. KBW04]
MANITQRGNSFRVLVSIPKGKPITQTFSTRAEAVAWGGRQDQKKSRGELTATSGKTVGELLEIYLDMVAAKSDSGRWNRMRIEKWLQDPISALPVAKITAHDMNVWIDRRSKDKTSYRAAGKTARQISGSTVNREVNLWSAAFTYAVKSLKWIPNNPCHGVNRPPEAPSRNRALLTKDEIQKICAAGRIHLDPKLTTKTARVTATFLLALETGMRSGELLRLRPIDYRKSERRVHVAALEIGGRKGSKSGRVQASRYVPLTGRAMQLLDQLLVTMPPDQEARKGLTQPPYIIGLDDAARDVLWRKVRDAATVTDLTFHDTKHEACTRLSKVPGVDVIALSHAVGTKDIRLLRDTYYINDATATANLLPDQLALNAKAWHELGSDPT